MSNFPIIFKDNNALMSFAQKFIVEDRLASLKNDVNDVFSPYGHKAELAGYVLRPPALHVLLLHYTISLGSLYHMQERKKSTTRHLVVIYKF